MEMKQEKSFSHSFVSAVTLTKKGVSTVPEHYVFPPSERPNLTVTRDTIDLPVIDFSSFDSPTKRSMIIEKIEVACSKFGFFQVVNHGVPESVLNDTLDITAEFFRLPIEEKTHLISDDVYKPVRYGTSLNQANDKTHCWRDFLKLYAHPISEWIHLWPSDPPSYKETMANYATALQLLQKKIWGAVLESLNQDPNYLIDEVEQGSQVMAVNFYPACPQPDLTLGIPPHSDFSALTILLQSDPGLEVMDELKNWVPVPVVKGALIVQLGDQMEVISNGRYKSVIHRAIVNSKKERISIASLHSLPKEMKVGPAPDLIDEQHPKGYKEFSFQNFLEYISSNDISQGRFIDTMKNEPLET